MCTIFLNTPVVMLHLSLNTHVGGKLRIRGVTPQPPTEQPEWGLAAEVPCLHHPPSCTGFCSVHLQFQEDPALGSRSRKHSVQFLNILGCLNSLFSWLFICGDLGEHVLYSSKHKNLPLYVRYAYMHVCFMYVYMYACVLVYRHTWRSIGMNISM